MGQENSITACGILKRDSAGREAMGGYLYWLEVERKSGTADTIMVVSGDGGLPAGKVSVTGRLHAEYVHGMGVPAAILADSVDMSEHMPMSRACLTGQLKAEPYVRDTRRGHAVATLLIATEDDGQVPVLLWDGNARAAAGDFHAGDVLLVSGRMQSREFQDRKGVRHTTYELSAWNAERMA